jgi:CubicO group peptidase (beta-lactamase class C family)
MHMVPQKNFRLDRQTLMKGAAASAALLSRAAARAETRGWGFGLSVITRRDNLSDVRGRYGRDGGFGTSFNVDPKEGLIGVLMCQRLWDPSFLALHHDFWTQAYQTIDD